MRDGQPVQGADLGARGEPLVRRGRMLQGPVGDECDNRVHRRIDPVDAFEVGGDDLTRGHLTPAQGGGEVGRGAEAQVGGVHSPPRVSLIWTAASTPNRTKELDSSTFETVLLRYGGTRSRRLRSTSSAPDSSGRTREPTAA